MKKIILLLNLLVVGFSYAQTNLTQTENYIYEKNCLTEDCSKKTESVQYFDGLGRAKQNVAVKATPSGKDIAVPIEYDAYGRQLKSYLPVPQSGTQNGALYANPLSNTASIYGNEKIYAEKVLESSPLGRPQQQKQVGNEWNTKPVQFGYDTNKVNEVYQHLISTTWENGVTKSVLSLSPTETYAPGQLYKSTVKNEDEIETVEFKNKKGQTILVRKMLSASEQVDTYYVYNIFGQLVFVLPPSTLHKPITDDLLNDLCYQYRYDTWGRLAEKKIPGKGWEYMVYDNQNRLVASQDANLKEKGQWMYTKYDQFGRVAFTGIATGGDRKTEQGLVDGISNNNVKKMSSAVFNRQGMDVFYDPATTYPHASKWVTLLSVNYYDTYPSYSFNPAFPSSIMGKVPLSDNSAANAVSTKGLPVMSLVKNIEDDNWTKNYVYYDAKGRVIGTYSINHLGGYSKTESELDFAGLALRTKVYHKRLNTDTEKVITQTYSYDHQNRLLVHKHKVDNNPEEILSQNTYNELSQITNKKTGGTNGSTPLQSIDYTYNIRGWLTKINDPANLNGKLFGYEIRYNAPANPAQAPAKYNGTISEIDWKTSNDQVLRRYDYQYDALNRMKKGIYSEPGSSVPQNNFFNEALNYDQNGNITALQRNGKSTAGMAEMIDNLSYSYTGNRLIFVADASYNYKGYPDTSGKTITYDNNGNMTAHQDKGILQINYNFLNLPDYMMFDKMYYTRGLWQNENTYYFYKADGTKHRKEHRYSENSVYRKRTTDYLDGFQYEEVQNVTPYTLKFVPTAEGYYSFQDNKYIYNYKDHLGNVRLSYFNNGNGAEVLEENNYYPFGMKHEGYNVLAGNPAFNQKYNNKELQKETGWLDYGWRQYMPDLGRWNGIDQLAESYFSTSTYAYVANNPVSNTDPDGRWINEDGSIRPSTTFDYMPGSYKPTMSFSTNDGMHYNEGGGGGYTPFGRTQAYADLMTAFFNGGTAGVSNKDGVLRWWTDYEDPDPTVTGIGAFGMLKLKASYEYDSNMHKISQDIRKYSAYGFTLSKMLQAGYEHASLYGKPPAYTTTSLYYEQKIFGKKILSVKLPFRQMNADKALKYAKFAKGAAIGLGAVSAGLGIYDMVQNGVTTSNTLDTTMSVLAATPTGVTQGIATAYFTLNFISTLTTGKDIGQHLDANGYNLGEYLNNLK